jgi:RHS repeat-associated protein
MMVPQLTALRKKNVYRFLYLLALLATSMLQPFAARAGVEPFENNLRGTIRKGDTLWVKDEKFRSTTFNWSSIEKQKARNFIELKIFRDTNRVVPGPLTCTLRLKIEYFTSPDQPEPIAINNVDLTVRYLSDTSSQNILSAMYSFENAHAFKITVDSIMGPQYGNTPPPFLQLNSQIIVDRKYVFDPTAPISMTMIYENGNNQSNTEALPSFGRYSFSWDNTTATEYDIEFTGIDETPENQALIQQMNTNGNPSTDDMNLLFRHNATRITTDKSNYSVTLSHYNKYLICRWRGVSYSIITNEDQEQITVRVEGEWNYRINIPSGGTKFAIEPLDWHYPALNWQYTATFAEEGKKKEVMSYFDGSLRGRQTVTLNNTDNQAILQENIYDEFGRPVVNILPSPIGSTLLQFYPGQHKNLAGNAYTFRDVKNGTSCEPTPAALNNSSGAAAYYSSNNESSLVNADYAQNPFLRYIPDAEGYPFTVTHYTPDNTGRIRLQGGVGKEFQPSSTSPSHTTKYYYGKPEQKELDRIFGNDVGYAEHYLKNMVIDANGQVSISYVDAAGKTIATALTGKNPDQLAPLPGKPAKKTETNNLIWPSQFVFDAAALSIKASTTYMASVTGDATLKYDLKKLLYQYQRINAPGFTICHECHYSLTIKVTDDCGAAIAIGTMPLTIGASNFTVLPTAGATCTVGPNQQGDINLNFSKIGEYNISFELALLKNTMLSYVDQYIAERKQRNDLKSEYEFIKTYLNSDGFKSCYDDCRTCEEMLGTFTEFDLNIRKVFTNRGVVIPAHLQTDFTSWITALYNDLSANCTAKKQTCVVSPCDKFKSLMLDDVSPGGQYALFDDNGNPYEPTINVISIRWRTVFPNDEPSTSQEYQNNIVLKDDGTTMSANNPSFTLPDLIKYWKPEWAEKFLQYHPEFCKLEFCNANTASYSFDERIETEIVKASQLTTHPLTANQAAPPFVYNNANAAFLVAKDPFFQSGGAGASYSSAFQLDLQNFTERVLKLPLPNGAPHKSLTQYIDWLLYCVDGTGNTNSTNNVNNTWGSCTPKPECRVIDREWQLYKMLYQQAKEIYYQQVRSNTTCANECIIGDPLDFGGNTCPKRKAFSVTAVTDNTGCAAGERKLRISLQRPYNNVIITATYKYWNTGTGTLATGSTIFQVGVTSKEICVPSYVLPSTLYIDQVSCQLVHPSQVINNCETLLVPSNTSKTNPDPNMVKYEFADVNTGYLTSYFIIKSLQQPNAADICNANGGAVNEGVAQFKKCLKVQIAGRPMPELYTNVWVVKCKKDLCATPVVYNMELQFGSHKFYADGKTYYITSSTGSAAPECTSPVVVVSNLPCIRVNVAGSNNPVYFFNATISYCNNCDIGYQSISVLSEIAPNTYSAYDGTYLIYPNTTSTQILSTSYCTNAQRSWVPCIYLTINGVSQLTPLYNVTVFFCPTQTCTQPITIQLPLGTMIQGPQFPVVFEAIEPVNGVCTTYYYRYIIPAGSTLPPEFQSCPTVQFIGTGCVVVGLNTFYNVDVYECIYNAGNCQQGGGNNRINISQPDSLQNNITFYNTPVYKAIRIAEHQLTSQEAHQVATTIYNQRQSNESFYINKTDNVLYLIKRNTTSSTILAQRQHFKDWAWKEHLYVRVDTNFYLNFRNVWVTTYQPTTGIPTTSSVLKNTIQKNNAKTATGNNPITEEITCSEVLYQYKLPRFPLVNFASFTDINSNPDLNNILNNMQDEGIANLQEVINNSCEGYADTWMQKLAGCVASPQQLNDIRDGLIAVCKAGGDMEHPSGASTSPVAATQYGDKSFKDVLVRILGDAGRTLNCSQLLLESPYPWSIDKKIQPADLILVQSSPDICTKLEQYKTDYAANPGGATSLHQYLINRFNTATQKYYTLTEQELAALDQSCSNCRFIISTDIKLPPVFTPNGCITRPEFNTVLTEFNTTAFATDVTGNTSDNYYTTLATFINHRLFFTLSGEDYKQFINDPTRTTLCTEPLFPDVPQPKYECINAKINGAITNGLVNYENYIVEVKRQFRLNYIYTCMSSAPMVKLTAETQTYHYTLYYYDQAGNLVKTVPPAGVTLLGDAAVERVDRYRRNMSTNCIYAGPNANTDSDANKQQLNNTLAAGNYRSMEGWFYNPTPGSLHFLTGTIPVVSTPLNDRYFLQLCVSGTKLSAEIYTIQSQDIPGSGSNLDFVLSNHHTVDLAGVNLEEWTHVTVQGQNLPLGPMSIYVNGVLMPVVAGAPPVGCGWQVGNEGVVELPENYSEVKHLRLYNRQLTPAEIIANANSNCFAIETTTAQSVLQWWARFNTPTGPGITTNWQNTTNETKILPVYPGHALTTTYQYNSLGQVVQQQTPDAGISRFWYDMLGRLVLSQNAKQYAASNSEAVYSYTKYDPLGRITEVGERNAVVTLPAPGYLPNSGATSPDVLTTTGTGIEVTQTFYDAVPAAPPAGFDITIGNTLRNLRKRVAATLYREQDNTPVLNATYYNYDISGNVHTLWQQVNGLGTKKIKYEYDLVSGKVNTVSYQPGVTNEEFYYHYVYDAENRIVEAQTSNQAVTTQNLSTVLMNPKTDARYKYYPHGPLARMELGHDKVQGVDYAYTLQGWMKGINGNRLTTGTTDGGDIGGDGRTGTPYVNNARDVFAFTIGYYHGDYKPVYLSANPPVVIPHAFSLEFANTPTGFGASLFNGNISHTTIALSQFNSGNPTGYTYKYDQLNRITAMQQHVLGGPGSNSWSNSTGNTPQLYAEAYSYDANGNIVTLNRNGNKPASLAMDQLGYHYIPGTNQLDHVTDQVVPGAYTDAEVQDVETQAAGNYTYDEIGNMTSDLAEGITSVYWTVYGKIRTIAKTKNNIKTEIHYSYDAAGNRVRKEVSVITNQSTTTTNTYYLRDAQGNVLALYEQPHGGSIAKTEQHLYGSSRLGMYRPVQPGITTAHREYELSNHLGNVVAVISDRKIGIDLGNNGTIDYYEAEVISQNDYYPFGMTMPGRKFTAASGYRYGFNGKEVDTEVKGDGNQQDYGMRPYDPRLGRLISVDPLTKKFPWYTPYQFAGNNPIRNIDFLGGQPEDFMENWIRMTIVDGKTGVEARSVIDMHGRDYRVIYDKVTQKAWFIHEGNNGQYEYWEHNPGANQQQMITSNSGRKNNGQWKSFETKNQQDDARRARVAGEFVEGFSTAIFLGAAAGAAAPAASSALSALSTSYAGRGVINATIDAGSQLIANGGNINDLNLTSIGASLALPNVKSFSGILFKNTISEGLQFNSGDGYIGFFGEGVNNTNVFINIGIGAVLDKTSASLQNLNSGVTNATLGRWNNLSYKPKFADKLQRFQRNQTVENALNSSAGQATVGALSNLLQTKPN